MTSISSPIHELRSSLISICFSLFQSLLTLFNAFLTFGRDVVGAVISLGQALFKAAVGIAGGVMELVWANMFTIALLAGGYYLYTTYSKKSPRKGKKRAG